MKCKGFFRSFVIFLVSAIICVSFFAVSSSAETYTKQTANSVLSLVGQNIPFTYVYDGVQYSGSFQYQSVNTGNWCNGANIVDNTVAAGVNSFNTYEIISYMWVSPFNSATSIYNVDISLNFSFTGGARGGFLAAGLGSVTTSNVTTDLNNVSNGGNYAGSFSAPSCNSQVDSSLANYYAVVNGGSYWGSDRYFRPILYDSTDFQINHVHYNRIRTFAGYPSGGSADQVMFFYIMCPYTYGSFSAQTAEFTTTGTGTGSGSVDLSGTNSLLDRIRSGISDMGTALSNLGESILRGIRGIFVPSDEFMEDFSSDIDDIKERFAFSEEIKEAGEDLLDIMENRENVVAPVVVIPSIQNARTGHTYSAAGETVLDLSDFETEVVLVRGILAVLLWIFFLWRVFARLPDIIHGSGMILGDGSRIMNELDNRESQAIFNDIENHANSIFQGTMPDISYIENPDKVDWKV